MPQSTTTALSHAPPPSYENVVRPRVMRHNEDMAAMPEHFFHEVYKMVDALETTHALAVMINCSLMIWLVIITLVFMYEWSEYFKSC